MGSGLILPASAVAKAAAADNAGEYRPEGIGSCKECVARVVANNQVECRRGYPQATILLVPAPPPRTGIAPQIISCFPLIEDTWWCMNWSPRKAPSL